MLINVAQDEECRIAIVENGKLEEFYFERAAITSYVGNIYKGNVTNIEPSIQACFIDFGVGQNGFLHISSCSAQATSNNNANITPKYLILLSQYHRLYKFYYEQIIYMSEMPLFVNEKSRNGSDFVRDCGYSRVKES